MRVHMSTVEENHYAWSCLYSALTSSNSIYTPNPEYPLPSSNPRPMLDDVCNYVKCTSEELTEQARQKRNRNDDTFGFHKAGSHIGRIWKNKNENVVIKN